MAMLLKKRTAKPPDPLAGTSIGPRGIGDLSPEVLRRLYFTTTSSASLPNQFEKGARPGEEVRQARSESMQSLTSGVRGYKRTQVRGVQRDDCTYMSHFVEKPLDANAVNRELASINRIQSREGELPSKSLAPIGDATTNKHFYSQSPEALRRGGRGECLRPAENGHFDKNARSLVRQSASQADYQEYDAASLKRSRSEPARPPPSSHLPAIATRLDAKTQYRRDFSASRHRFRASNS